MLKQGLCVLVLGLGYAYADDDHYLYDQIRANQQGKIWAGNYRLMGEHPLLPYLAPSMWIEAKGHWQKNQFVAEELKTLEPQVWVYYQGNYHGTWKRLWFTPKDMLYSENSTKQDKTVLVGWVQQGSFVALPQSLSSALHVPKLKVSGWVYLSGVQQKQGIVWQKPQPLSPNDD